MEILAAVLGALGLGTASGFFIRAIVTQRGENKAKNRASAIVVEGEE